MKTAINEIKLRKWCIVRVINNPALHGGDSRKIINAAQDLYDWIIQSEEKEESSPDQQ